ncbi:hypothetical protein PR048_027847 [Dryococelus australis]|uniref:Uncharacterized protein n=1 Tax=Dryococelus australis TaxID=614101 RepID=A0ABQ9GHN0_9NEOP|nr:hypothetical protein PR048_027847 [Dryococelus australis]
MKVIEVSMELHRNERMGQTGEPRGEPGLIPGRVTPGCSYVAIVSDDAAGWRYLLIGQQKWLFVGMYYAKCGRKWLNVMAIGTEIKPGSWFGTRIIRSRIGGDIGATGHKNDINLGRDVPSKSGFRTCVRHLENSKRALWRISARFGSDAWAVTVSLNTDCTRLGRPALGRGGPRDHSGDIGRIYNSPSRPSVIRSSVSQPSDLQPNFVRPSYGRTGRINGHLLAAAGHVIDGQKTDGRTDATDRCLAQPLSASVAAELNNPTPSRDANGLSQLAGHFFKFCSLFSHLHFTITDLGFHLHPSGFVGVSPQRPPHGKGRSQDTGATCVIKLYTRRGPSAGRKGQQTFVVKGAREGVGGSYGQYSSMDLLPRGEGTLEYVVRAGKQQLLSTRSSDMQIRRSLGLVRACCVDKGIQWLAYSPPAKVILPAGSPPDFLTWDSCRMTPLPSGFSRGFPVFPVLALRRCSMLTSTIVISSQDLAAKSRPNIFHSSLKRAYEDVFWLSTSLPGAAGPNPNAPPRPRKPRREDDATVMNAPALPLPRDAEIMSLPLRYATYRQQAQRSATTYREGRSLVPTPTASRIEAILHVGAVHDKEEVLSVFLLCNLILNCKPTVDLPRRRPGCLGQKQRSLRTIGAPRGGRSPLCACNLQCRGLDHAVFVSPGTRGGEQQWTLCKAINLLASHQGERGSIHRQGHSQIFANGNRAGRRHCSAGFLGISRPCISGAAPFSPHFTLIGSQDLVVKNHPNLPTQLKCTTVHYESRLPAYFPAFFSLSSAAAIRNPKESARRSFHQKYRVAVFLTKYLSLSNISSYSSRPSGIPPNDKEMGAGVENSKQLLHSPLSRNLCCRDGSGEKLTVESASRQRAVLGHHSTSSPSPVFSLFPTPVVTSPRPTCGLLRRGRRRAGVLERMVWAGKREISRMNLIMSLCRLFSFRAARGADGLSDMDNLNYRRNDNFLVTVAKTVSSRLGIVRARNPKL